MAGSLFGHGASAQWYRRATDQGAGSICERLSIGEMWELEDDLVGRVRPPVGVGAIEVRSDAGRPRCSGPDLDSDLDRPARLDDRRPRLVARRRGDVADVP